MFSPADQKEKMKNLHGFMEELKEVRYSDILSNCIYNCIFMEEYFDAVGHLFYWSKVKTDISSDEVRRFKKDMTKTINPQEVLLYRLLNFWHNGLIMPWKTVPFVSISRETEVVAKIKDALNIRN